MILRVLGIDPGFANCGVSIVDYDTIEDTFDCLSCFTIHTKKRATKKNNIYVADDNLRRIREVSEALLDIIETYKPHIIIGEGKVGGRFASQAKSLSFAWGAIIMLSVARKIPTFQVFPKDIKEALTGKIDSDKDEIKEAVISIIPDIELPKRKTRVEHAVDATAAIITGVRGVNPVYEGISIPTKGL